jgi:hypothetical protein
MGESAFLPWTVSASAKLTQASLAVASRLVEDYAENSYLYDPTGISRSLKRSKEDKKVILREVTMPVLPAGEKLVLVQQVSLLKDETSARVVFTVDEEKTQPAGEWKGTIEVGVGPMQPTEEEIAAGASPDAAGLCIFYTFALENVAELDEAKAASLTEHCQGFAKRRGELVDYCAKLVEEKNLLDLETPGVHAVLEIAKRFHPIPDWLPIAASGVYTDPKQPAPAPPVEAS